MLEIKNLLARVDGNEILRGINLTVNAGEVHAIMGPNGSGKSTLAGVLAGRDAYDVTEGEVLFEGKNLLEMDPEERAREGLFMAFQYPVEIPGVSNTYFLRAAVNAIRKHRGQEEIDAMDFLDAGQAENESPSNQRRSAQAPGQRRIFRRREESVTKSSKWRCSSRNSPSWTRPIPDWTSMPCESWRTASTPCAARTGPFW